MSSPSCSTASDFVPPEHAYRRRFVVEASDIDELGHANNVVWVRWVAETAVLHSRSVGLDWDAYRALNVFWVVRRHEIDYLVSALEGEALDAVTWIATVRGATVVRRTIFRRVIDDKLLARASTTWALVNLAGKPRRVPEEILRGYGFST